MVDFEGDLRIVDGDGDGWPVVDVGADEFRIPNILVEIDVTPSIPDNIIKLRPATEMDVAILGTDEFYVEEVSPETVRFAGASPVRCTLVDVDGDDDLDLLLYFNTPDLELDVSTNEATLTGETVQGAAIEGSDEVIVLRGKGPT